MEEGRTLAPAEDFSVPLARRTLKADRFGTKLVQSLSTAAPWGSQGGGGGPLQTSWQRECTGNLPTPLALSLQNTEFQSPDPNCAGKAPLRAPLITGTEQGMGSRAALFPTELAFRGNEIPNSVSHAIVRLQSERHTAQVGSAQQQRAGTSALSHAALGTQRARNGGGGGKVIKIS